MKKEILHYPLLIILLIFLFGFTVLDVVLPDKKYSDLENRTLAQRPKLTMENLFNNEFSRKYEEYIDDQMLGRDVWIDVKSRAEFALGKIENNGIVYGQDGYMFEKYQTTNEMRLNKNVAYIKQFIEACDDPVTFMIVPSSYMQNEDKLPYGLANLNQYQYINRIYDQLGKVMNRQGVKTKCLSLEEQHLKYYKTDHHWTTLGAYKAYEVLMQQMNLPAAGVDDLAPLERIEGEFYGTYFNKTKAFNAQPDEIVYYDLPVKKMMINGKEAEGLYDFDKLNTRDKYGMFLHGNNGITEIESAKLLADAGKGKRILLIKDSFGNCFAPFLTFNFEQVSVVDLRSIGTKLSQYLEENEFDEVVILYNFMNLAQDANIAKITY